MTWRAAASVVLVLIPLVSDFWISHLQGYWLHELGVFDADAKAGWRSGRRDGERHWRIGSDSSHRQPIGVPLGIGAGIYLAEYGRNRFGDLIRFTADVLNGVPSIVIGIVAYGVVVLTAKTFFRTGGRCCARNHDDPYDHPSHGGDASAGSAAVREAAYGLGVPRWRTTLSITLRTATSGVITGVMLAFARVAGETAPLLFTAFGNQFWNCKVNQPTAALPLQIFTYAISPFDEWHRQAWAGAP